MQFDLPVEQLEKYRPAPYERTDFDAFWASTLAQARGHDLDPTYERVDVPFRGIDCYDVRFCGFGGERIAAWLLVPSIPDGPLPCVVEFAGYSFGRGYPHEALLFPVCGYAYLLMDNRGQGGRARVADTPDLSPDRIGAHTGMLVSGIADPQTYYYRRLFTDAVRAVECARAHPDVDDARVALRGVSQGGGIALAAAALSDGLRGAIVNVPFLCNFPRAISLVDTSPYNELSTYLATYPEREQQTVSTLSYFDGMHFAARAHCPALFSVGLADMVTPPSTVYAAYNRYAHRDRSISVWPYNGHEGGQTKQVFLELEFLAAHLGGTPDD